MRILVLFLVSLSLGLAAEVTPPILLYKVPAAITEQARSSRLTGTARIRILIDENGVPREVRFLEIQAAGQPVQDPLGMDRSVETAVSMWRFTPLKVAGVPRAVHATVELSF